MPTTLKGGHHSEVRDARTRRDNEIEPQRRKTMLTAPAIAVMVLAVSGLLAFAMLLALIAYVVRTTGGTAGLRDLGAVLRAATVSLVFDCGDESREGFVAWSSGEERQVDVRLST